MNDFEPLVSAIIPVYNGAAYICETLESVLSQTYPKLEVVVVNDASTDESAGLLHQYGERITYIERPVNRGVAASRNAGVAASHGDLVAFLDQDDLWLPERISRGVEAFFANPKAGLVAANTYVQEGENRIACWRRVVRTGDRITKRLLADNFICSAGAMVSRRALDEVGFFDESFYGADDFDLWYRIAGKFEVVLIDEPLAVWKRRPSSLSSNTERMLKDIVNVYNKILSVEENDEEREIAAHRRLELLFKLGIVQSLSGDDGAARETFRQVAELGAPSFEAGLAIRLHAISPALFRFARSFRAGRGPELPIDIELVV
ncbi:MAG: glycosyltransferase [Actinobacteria bacterium]|nr:glycosyltransferase [Actinomycetota bacterium]